MFAHQIIPEVQVLLPLYFPGPMRYNISWQPYCVCP